jgi:regulator of protease activity HflC (stomatin/prohibitin superfamily)
MKLLRELFTGFICRSKVLMKSFREWLAGFCCRSKLFIRRHVLSLIALGMLASLILAFFFNQIFVSIYPGELGVLWRRLGEGTVIDTVYGEGMHVILPINKMYIYNMRKQQFNETIDVLTLDGLTVKVKYTARYYLEKDTVTLLHQRVGPDYVNVVVRPDVRSVIRTWFGQYKPEEIYTSQTAMQLRVSEQSKIRMAARFVTLDDVLIESISLPTKISEAIESKLTQQQLEAGYVYRLSIAQKESERLRIESAGVQLYNDTVNKSLTSSVLKWHGIQATQELAKSPNAKIVVIGAGNSGMPLILGKD